MPDAADQPGELYDALELPQRGAAGPFVFINMVATLDGKVTMARGDSSDIGSDFDHRLMAHIRTHADAVMHGAGTVRPYKKHVGRAPELDDLRRAHGAREQFLWVILSNSGDLPDLEPTRPEWRPLVIVSERTPSAAKARLSAWADVAVCPAPSVDLAWTLQHLQEVRGCRRVLGEGGPSINHELVERRLVDQLFLTLAPKLAGGERNKSLVEGRAVLAAGPFALLSAFRHGDELFLRYGLDS